MLKKIKTLDYFLLLLGRSTIPVRPKLEPAKVWALLCFMPNAMSHSYKPFTVGFKFNSGEFGFHVHTYNFDPVARNDIDRS